MTYVHLASRASAIVPFFLASMTEVSAPEGCSGTWHHYVIKQGDNTIKGMRCGSHDEVSLLLRDLIDRLNGRFLKGHKDFGTAPARGRRRGGSPAAKRGTA